MTSTRDPERLVDSRAADDAELGQLLRRAAALDPAPAQVEQVITRVLTQLGPARPSALRRHGPWLATVGLLLAGGAWLASTRGARVVGPVEAPPPAVVEPAPSAASARPSAAPSAPAPAAQVVAAEPGAPSAALREGERVPRVGDVPTPAHERTEAALGPAADAAPSASPRGTPTASAAPRVSVSSHGQAAPAASSARAPGPERDRTRARAGATSGVPDDELTLLVRAQRALAHAPLEALTALHAHAAAHPRGRYAEERDALVCDALARLGRSDELHAAAAAFLALHAGSPLAPRIARYLDGARNSRRQSTHSDSGPATTLTK